MKLFIWRVSKWAVVTVFIGGCAFILSLSLYELWLKAVSQ